MAGGEDLPGSLGIRHTHIEHAGGCVAGEAAVSVVDVDLVLGQEPAQVGELARLILQVDHQDVVLDYQNAGIAKEMDGLHRFVDDHPDDRVVDGVGDAEADDVDPGLVEMVTDPGQRARAILEEDRELLCDMHRHHLYPASIGSSGGSATTPAMPATRRPRGQ